MQEETEVWRLDDRPRGLDCFYARMEIKPLKFKKSRLRDEAETMVLREGT
jgi:hypothetical protein